MQVLLNSIILQGSPQRAQFIAGDCIGFLFIGTPIESNLISGVVIEFYVSPQRFFIEFSLITGDFTEIYVITEDSIDILTWN